MRLFFPGGEHPDIELEPGETRVGLGAGERVLLGDGQDTRERFCLFLGPLGLWLHVPDDRSRCHLNGRPVRELALLRAGDLISLGPLRVQVRGQRPPGFAPASPADGTVETDPARVCRQVLRGVAGPCSGETVAIGARLTLGSGPEADIRLADPGLPAAWVRIERDRDGARARTLVPGLAFEVNGWRVERALLRGGDQLTCGSHRYLIEWPQTAADSDAAESDPEPVPVAGDEPAMTAGGRLGAGLALLLAATVIAILFTLALL